MWRRLFCPLPKNPTFIKLPGNFYKMCFVGTVALFSLWTKSFRGHQNLDPSWQFFVSIRTCQIPIGRAQPKNWNLWLCHIKQRSGKKVDRILCWWYRDWWQSIRGMTREVLKCLLLLYESKEWPKKGTGRPTEIAKNTKNLHETAIRRTFRARS